MCGIVAYTGNKPLKPILLSSLKRLEYRGYDSTGVCWIKDNAIHLYKAKGKIENLVTCLEDINPTETSGMGHTRWATHGRPSDINAHPHVSKDFAIVHNGIIENYKELRTMLKDQGIIFQSDTDTEVLIQLIQHHFNHTNDIHAAINLTVKEIKGFFAFAVMHKDKPKQIITAKYHSPLVIGISEDATYIASDIPAVIPYTQKFIILDDESIATINTTTIHIHHFNGETIIPKETTINWTPVQAEKSGYKHFMQKEIFEQPKAIQDTLLQFINRESDLYSLNSIDFNFSNVKRVHLLAMGTSYFAGLIGKYIIETLARIPVDVEYGAEFRYRNPVIEDGALIVPISQSGETADTLAAVNAAKEKNIDVLAITNVFQSSIPRASNTTFYTQAGPEIGVASTKAFTCQIATLYILGCYLANIRKNLNAHQLHDVLTNILKIPSHLHSLLEQEDHIKQLAKQFFKYENFLFLGRGINYPIALEGALKLKEISYIHAEGYLSAEMKHGPIALIDEKMPVVLITPDGPSYSKVVANLDEVKARDGKVISLVSQGNTSLDDQSDAIIHIPLVDEFYSPILTITPLQLFSYHIAVLRGTDVDQPRNLAKSVTVE